MSDGYDDFDPYEDLMDLTGTEGLPALEDPMTPQATPPRSPLLMGLIVGLFLVVTSIAAFKLIGAVTPVGLRPRKSSQIAPLRAVSRLD